MVLCVSEGIAPVAVESPKMEARKEETMKQEIHDMLEMMKSLSLNLLNGRGRPRAVNGLGARGVPNLGPSFSGGAGCGRRLFAPNV